MSSSRTPRGMATDAPLRHPRTGQGEAQGQEAFEGFLDDDSPAAWIVRLYAAANLAAEEYGGQDALAADMGVSRQVLNARLGRRQDSKGDLQRLHLDALGHLFSGSTGKAARWAFAAAICEMVGAKPPELQRALTPTEKAAILGGALTDKVKRQLEREHGLPAGSLD